VGSESLRKLSISYQIDFDKAARTSIIKVMKNLMTVALAAFLFQGCSQLVVNPEFEVAAPPLAAENLQAALTAYGKPNAKPEVHWYGQKAITCGGTCQDGGPHQGWDWWGFTDPQTGECVAGLTEGSLTIVLEPPANFPVWTTSLAHEVIHNDEVFGITGHPHEYFGAGPSICADPTGSTLALGINAQMEVQP
jgi:hypothetical protein